MGAQGSDWQLQAFTHALATALKFEIQGFVWWLVFQQPKSTSGFPSAVGFCLGW